MLQLQTSWPCPSSVAPLIGHTIAYLFTIVGFQSSLNLNLLLEAARVIQQHRTDLG
jgi:hypothetical protein